MKNKRYSLQVLKIFKEKINVLDLESASKTNLFKTIVDALGETIRYFKKLNIEEHYQLYKYLDYSANDYPIEYAEGDTKSYIEWFYSMMDKEVSLDDIARAIVLIMDEMLYHSLNDFSCPRCESGVLVMRGENSGKLALVCEVCTWKEYIDEGDFESAEKFIPVKTSSLIDKGFTPKV